MPIPIERPSLTTNLESRYATNKAGGAYDAKAAGPQGGQLNPVNDFLDTDAEGFVLNKGEQITVSDFKSTKNGSSASAYLSGFTNKKYKP